MMDLKCVWLPLGSRSCSCSTATTQTQAEYMPQLGDAMYEDLQERQQDIPYTPLQKLQQAGGTGPGRKQEIPGCAPPSSKCVRLCLYGI